MRIKHNTKKNVRRNRVNNNKKKNKNNRKTNKNKQRRIISMKKAMKGGNHLTLSVDTSRFDIQMRTNELHRGGLPYISQNRFLIVTDKMTNKQYIVDADTNDVFNLFIFDGDKYYVYYIYYNDMEYPITPIESTETIERQMKIINDDSLGLYEKIDELTEVGLNFVINLRGDDYNEIKMDYVMNLDGAFLRLNELNRILKTKCPMLELKLNYLINQPGIVSTYFTENLTLCLYNQGNCISSIMCKLENYPQFGITEEEDLERERPIPNSFEIASETNLSVQGRKFNKLLRAVLIIISNQIIVDKNRQIVLPPLIKPPVLSSQSTFLPRFPPPPSVITESGNHIRYILSDTINPKSAWLLINYYNAEIVEDDFVKYVRKREKMENRKIGITKHLIEEFMKQDNNINTKIELTDVNINRAMEEFNLTINGPDINSLINCENIEQDWSRRKLSRNTLYADY